MSRWFGFVTTALLGFAVAFTPALPARAGSTLNASWVVTYYSDPTGVFAGSQCLNFVISQRKNGVINGTWSSPSLAGWAGSWIQKGEHYSWYGTYPSHNGHNVATFDSGDFINPTIGADTSAGSFDAANGNSIFTGTATLVQVKNCNDMPVHVNGAPLQAAP